MDNTKIWDDFNQRNTNFDDRFATLDKLFFIVFGIVVTIVMCIFIFVIFTICFRICKGESFEDYRRQHHCQTIIPPPPPLTNSCNYFQTYDSFRVLLFFVQVQGIDYTVLCAVNALGRTRFFF